MILFYKIGFLYYDQYVPETSFHGVYAHEQKLNI
jgi:hypothetical protein